jgi:hypothetical protein
MSLIGGCICSEMKKIIKVKMFGRERFVGQFYFCVSLELNLIHEENLGQMKSRN